MLVKDIVLCILQRSYATLFCTKTPPLPLTSLPGSIHLNKPCGTELLLSGPNLDVTKYSFSDYPINLSLRSDGFKPLQFNENLINCMLSTIVAQEGYQRRIATHPMWISLSVFSKFAAQRIVEELKTLQRGKEVSKGKSEESAKKPLLV